jgi:uncharacterized protein (TIGR02145 family)
MGMASECVDRGRAHEENGDIDKALVDYTEAIRLDPNYEDAYCCRGNVYSKTGHIDMAIADYNKAIHIDPKYIGAYYCRGCAYGDRGDADKAIADYSTAIQLDPRYALAYWGRGNTYKNKGDLDRALADYNNAIAFDPDCAPAYVSRGNIYSTADDLDMALADYNEALRLSPSAATYSLRGIVYEQKGDTDRALADYNAAIRLDPGYADAYHSRGKIHSGKGDLDKAIADYTEAIRLDPNEAMAYSDRGAAYMSKNNANKALADCTEAIRLDPNYEAAYFRRACCHSHLGHVQEAIRDFEKVLSLTNNSNIAADVQDAIKELRTSGTVNFNRYTATEKDVSEAKFYLGVERWKLILESILSAAGLLGGMVLAYKCVMDTGLSTDLLGIITVFSIFSWLGIGIGGNLRILKSETHIWVYTYRASRQDGVSFGTALGYTLFLWFLYVSVKLLIRSLAGPIIPIIKIREYYGNMQSAKSYIPGADTSKKSANRRAHTPPAQKQADQSPAPSVSSPVQSVAPPAPSVASPIQSVAPPAQSVVSPVQSVALPNNDYAAPVLKEKADGQTPEKSDDCADIAKSNEQDNNLSDHEYAIALLRKKADEESQKNDDEKDCFTDKRDGQKYRTVKIGDQVWMAENLNYKIDNSWGYDNDESNCKKYGRLYIWDAAMAACPAGWRLPSGDDWNKLITTAGGSSVAAKNLKSKNGWNSNGNGTDNHGFSALPGGYRVAAGNFGGAGNYGNWWTSKGYDSDNAYIQSMHCKSDNIGESRFKMDCGFSVRCVRKG